MHVNAIKSLIVFLTLFEIVFPNKSKEDQSHEKVGSQENSIEKDVSDITLMRCPTSKKSSKSSAQTKLIPLLDIESEDCTTKDVISKENKNLFFIESSGRNYLNPRDACAIESAVKNSGLAGHIIVAMTSPVLDVMKNNATCHLYSEHAGRNIFFRHVNVDTIFKGTPIHQLHIDGKLKSQENRKTIVQYR